MQGASSAALSADSREHLLQCTSVDANNATENMSSFTCLTAPGVVFEDKAAFTAATSPSGTGITEERTAQLPMVSLEELSGGEQRLKSLAGSKRPGHVKANKREKRSRRELEGVSC